MATVDAVLLAILATFMYITAGFGVRALAKGEYGNLYRFPLTPIFWPIALIIIALGGEGDR